jgi:ribonuclease P protein component
MTLTYLASPDRPGDPPRLAFAVPKKVGNAVERNRLRRRFRAAWLTLSRDPEAALPSGAYLLSARSDALTSSFEELTMDLRHLLLRLEALAARQAARSGDA